MGNKLNKFRKSYYKMITLCDVKQINFTNSFPLNICCINCSNILDHAIMLLGANQLLLKWRTLITHMFSYVVLAFYMALLFCTNCGNSSSVISVDK